MPSRNKRNKSRTSGGNAPKNEDVSVKATNSSTRNLTVCKEAESSQNNKSTITEAKEKLAELQQTVDSIKASVSQTSAASENINANTNAEAPSNNSDEQQNQSDQQTMKKKRNRNRNRKKNASNANENVVRSSSCTHENTPTNLAPISASATEEPQQSESNVSSEKIEVDCTRIETEQKVDEQQAISDGASREEIDSVPKKENTDQSISNDSNVEQINTDKEGIKIEPHEMAVDELREKIEVEEMLSSDPKSIKGEKLQETPIKNEIDELDLTITTDKNPEIGSQSEKIEEELKEAESKSGIKHDLNKLSPNPKNKNSNDKSGKEAKKTSNKNRKIEKKPPDHTVAPDKAKQIPVEQIKSDASECNRVVEESVIKSVDESQTAITGELTNTTADDSITVTSENIAKTPTSSPLITTPAPEPSKKPIQDETAKIWKILEEASKSLEPVEIQMDDEPMTNAIDPPIEINAPILCSSKNQQETEEKAKDLVALLQTTKPDKIKASAQSKPTNEIVQSEAKPEQTNPTKLSDAQKSVETPKTDSPKLSKSNQHTAQEISPMEKLMEEKHEQAQEKLVEKLVDQQPLPIDETNDTDLLTDDVIPLDVSMLPDHIDVPEMNTTDSKNVQGSDFVPSVNPSAAETKSLGLETIAKSDDIESNIVTSTSASKESTLNAVIVRTQNNGSSSNTSKKSPKRDDNKNKIKPSDQPMVHEKKRSCSTTEKPAQTNCNPKNPRKPAIPPKPDNLVSSQAKRSQAVSTKSAKVEKILVLTGANAIDEDSEDDYIEYKFMPRQVFIATICQTCKKPTKLNERILCELCNMVSYCSVVCQKNERQHDDLCAAFQEIAKKRGGHIYNNARILNDNDYRSLRVHTLNLCENFLKRPLQTYEREILLFPRLCSTASCREWRPNLLSDCDGCGQIFYCSTQPDHLVETHQRWCKSVALYRNLVVRQSVSGRIEPSLPSRIQNKPYILPNTIDAVFKDLYKNYTVVKDECVFATLTQLATAPLTAYFACQKAELKISEKFTIHLIGAELQFEADVLDIWETFFLHLAHTLVELTVVFCGPELNAENIPLDIISRIRMCRTCRQHCRIVKFDFQCAKFYHDYEKSTAYTKPDLICFFNPGFHHINSLNGFDTWSETIKVASMSECPVVVTSYTEYESPRDLDRFQHETANHGNQMDLIHGPSLNAYASQRPERNFISDEIAPLIFKNYFCFVLK